MGRSIGELFVSLGFDVDDKKLKEFNQGIQGAVDGILKLAGVTASAYGFAALTERASDMALKLRNLRTEFGANELAAQKFIGAFRVANPLGGWEEGIAAYQHTLQYIANIQRTGNSMALNMLGISPDNWGSPESIAQAIRRNLPSLLQRMPKGMIAQYVGEIMGTADAMNLLTMSEAEYQAAGAKNVIDQKDLDELVQYRQNLQDLGAQFDVFAAHIVSYVAPNIVSAMKQINESFNGGGSTPHYSSVSEWISKRGIGGALWDSFLSGSGIVKSGLEIEAGAATTGTQMIFGPTGSGNAMANAVAQTIRANGGSALSMVSMLEKFGWSQAQAHGIVARLVKESNLDPSAIGDNGQAYGLAQWHPDRQAAFKQWAGHDIHGSSVSEQLAFLNYEMTQGNEQAAGRLLRGATTESQAYDTFTRAYERPAVTQNNTINIHSTAPATAVADEVDRRLQQQINGAYAQTGLGPSH